MFQTRGKHTCSLEQSKTSSYILLSIRAIYLFATANFHNLDKPSLEPHMLVTQGMSYHGFVQFTMVRKKNSRQCDS